jgi:Ca2+-binding RTX toxin-like protein
MATIEGDLGANVLTGTRGSDLITGHAPLEATATAPTFETVATGLGQALGIVSAPGDAQHLYVLDKTGVIRIVDTATGVVQATPFLDMANEVNTDGERGLLGMTFHPDYWQNGKIYVTYSRLDGDTVIREYTVDLANPDVVPEASARTILAIQQPDDRTNHRAGWLDFGPDGMLYIATGDGGGRNDPSGTGQNPNDLLGSILRIDVDGPDAYPLSTVRNYAIPSDNPFVGGGGAREVWAYGLRNPFRNSFDRGTGELWIADVGQATFEEINIGASGANYGWSLYEGGEGPAPGFTFPAYYYGREDGDGSVIGGYVSRGPDSGLFGQYVFGDFRSGRIWALADRDGDGDLDRVELDDGRALGGKGTLTSFGEDGDGTLYVVSITGELLRIDGGQATGPLDGADTIRSGLGDDRVFAGAGDDVVRDVGSGNDLLSGMEGNDRLHGLGGDDLLIGGSGQDALWAGSGNDTLLGGTGKDRLSGEDGADLLIGGAGTDDLFGGAGADRFRWTTPGDSPGTGPIDRVHDFNALEGDKLDLSALADGTFAFIGGGGFAASGAQVRVVHLGDRQRVEVSVDGGPADLIFSVKTAVPLTADDFYL